MSGKYDDLLPLPHHVSYTRKHMSPQERAAQFSPFAALRGYEDEVKESGRLTDRPLEMDEYEMENVNARLVLLQRLLSERPQVSATFFKPDGRKAGGAYLTLSGTVKKLDEYRRVLVFAQGEEIPLDSIVALEGEAFREL